MGISIQRRRGTTAEHSSFTGLLGEMTVDITKDVVVIHDGTTVGGWPMAKEVHAHSEATTIDAGFLSAADKTKLNSISGGTINYQIVQANGTPQTSRNVMNLSANFTITDDGAGNRTTVELSDTGASNGTFTKLTVNTKGRVTNGGVLSAGDIPNLTAAKITDFTSVVQTSRLDQMASPASDVNLNSNKLINVADPIVATDAANKSYVDTIASGITYKQPCRAASIGSNVNLTAPGTSLDGVTLVSGNRILLKNQSDATKNGVYIFNGPSSTMSRALDANSSAEVISGMSVLITEGSVNGGTGYILTTNGTITLDSTNLTYVAFSASGAAAAGNGITVVGNTVSVNTVNGSRIAVGSGGVDLATTGVTAGTYSTFTVDVYGRITGTASTTFQTQNSNLTGLAAVTTTGFAVRTGSSTFAARTIQQGTGITVTNGDGVSGNVSVAVAEDTTLQRSKYSRAGSLISTRPELNFIEGSGVTITTADNSGSNRTDVTFAVAGGGGGAPTSAQYLTLAHDGDLTNERRLVNGAGITFTDAGANSTLTVSLITDFGTVP